MSGSNGLEPILTDPDVSEIMIPGPNNVWVERAGKLQPHRAPVLDEWALPHAAIHTSRPLGLDPAPKPREQCRVGPFPAGQQGSGRSAASAQHRTRRELDQRIEQGGLARNARGAKGPYCR